MDVSICIVNWNTCDLLRQCLASVYSHKCQLGLEVIVVDNASSDGSAEMVRAEFPQVRLVASAENRGFAAANNQAFQVAQGRHLLLLNPDTIVQAGALDTMVAFADAHPEVGALGCKLLNPDGTLQRSCWRGFPSLRSAIVDAFYLWRLTPDWAWVRASEISDAELQQTLEVDHVLGACMLVPRPVLEKAGPMDGSIFLFLEETEWCYRIREHGWKIVFLPAAQVIHVGQQSVHKNPERTLPEKYRNFVRFYRNAEHPSPIQEAILKGVIVLAGLLRVGLWTWRGRDALRRPQAQRMRLGYWEVVKQSMSF